jgi:hypothetical protein
MISVGGVHGAQGCMEYYELQRGRPAFYYEAPSHFLSFSLATHTRTHTHTHAYINIFTYTRTRTREGRWKIFRKISFSSQALGKYNNVNPSRPTDRGGGYNWRNVNEPGLHGSVPIFSSPRPVRATRRLSRKTATAAIIKAPLSFPTESLERTFAPPAHRYARDSLFSTVEFFNGDPLKASGRKREMISLQPVGDAFNQKSPGFINVSTLQLLITTAIGG